jgi:hypothetical protein
MGNCSHCMRSDASKAGKKGARGIAKEGVTTSSGVDLEHLSITTIKEGKAISDNEPYKKYEVFDVISGLDTRGLSTRTPSRTRQPRTSFSSSRAPSSLNPCLPSKCL